MDNNEKYKKQMTRDEVSYFTDLVKEKSAIHSKATNAFQNHLKEIAWTEVTDAYNARFGRVPKNKQQLKLKWDNLKKMARKRLQLIRYNNLKTGGGKPICIPVDEILDKVAELLGSTGSGFEVPFGGDGTENKENESIVLEEDNSEVATTEPPNQESVPGPSTEKKQKHEDVPTIHPKPISKRLFGNAKKKKDNDGRLQKNLAIAKYFEKKTEKLELEIKLLKTEISNLRDTNNK